MTPLDVILPADQQELKAATRALVRAFGGQEAASAATGYRQPRISDWGNPNVADFAALDCIAHLEGSTVGHPGAPHVTRLLARRAGFALVPLPDGADGGAEGGEIDPMVRLAHLSAELGDVSGALVSARCDGEIDARERAGIVAELDQLIDRACAMRAALSAGQGAVGQGAVGQGTEKPGRRGRK